MEKRYFSRIPFNVGAVIKWQEKSFKGEVENLSLQGMLAKTSDIIPVNEEVEITIYLTGVSPQIPVNLQGIITRSDENGIGVKFVKTSTESFIHLRNIMAHNTGDSGKVMDELLDFIKHQQDKEKE